MNGKPLRFTFALAILFAGAVLPGTTVAQAEGRVAGPPAAGAESQPAGPPAGPVVEWDGQDPQWPREITGSGGGKVVLYQPQIESWEETSRLRARVALAFAPAGQETPSLGAIEITADTEVSLETRKVKVANFEIASGNFPSLDEATSAKLVARLGKILPQEELIVDLDRILAGLERFETGSERQVALKGDPPVIFTSSSPAILVLLDGEPIWSPIEKNDLKYLVNTNWDLFHHEKTARYYLRNGDAWLRAASLDGFWVPAGKLPESFRKLPKKDPNWKEVRASLPGESLAPSQVPKVFVSTKPAELILTDDEPSLSIIDGTNLLWVTNTESDLFLSSADSHFYYLVSGRWFRAPGLDGPWAFATEDLPADFAKIPADHPRATVLASVPGTPQAQEAVMLALIPQKARVSKSEVTAEVSYAGDPEFKPIAGTSMAYAANTQSDVIQVGGTYYLCLDAVWFRSSSPTGPWQVADQVPEEIYTIPASSPVHHTTYVHVYDSGPDWVTVGYTSGYWGTYVAWGCVVYGTGWYYDPWYYYGPGYPYPYYYPYYPTYGMSAWYNPYTGTYGRGASVYGPYGGAGRAAAYNPCTGTYARGGAAWGPYNARGWAEAYNPRTGTYARTRQGANTYGSWGTTAVRRGDDWARTARASGDQGSIVAGRTSTGRGGFVAGDGNNLYAGRDGNVYRRNEGGWQQYDGGEWKPVDRQPVEVVRDRAATSERVEGARDRAGAGGGQRTVDGLNRDFKNRSQGVQRSRDYGAWKGSGGTYGGRGSFGGGRGSFGGGRGSFGGGGMRRGGRR